MKSLPTITADRKQLAQVFQNLISNAIEYCDEDPPQIEIGAERNDGEWELRVTDNGIGMRPEQTEAIFDIFQRFHTQDEYPGTGIGLSLCEKIVERHGGEIWVESEPDEGSTFYFTIPTTEGDCRSI
ncbi:sensor histidine kinase [Haloprofundus salilacus]|uniref:sensor histidine kinase n=1 Tax=Haloprofundus salilacus TaxID=2876190 RepID=UPI001CCA71EE|nr:ATP-binding protein [Haloprofundus salilacus]